MKRAQSCQGRIVAGTHVFSWFPGRVVSFNLPSQLLVRPQMNVNVEKVDGNPTAGVQECREASLKRMIVPSVFPFILRIVHGSVRLEQSGGVV